MLLTEQELRYDMNVLELTQEEIAVKHGCSRKTVQRRKDEYDVEKTASLRTYVTPEGRVYYVSGNDRVAEYALVAIGDGADPHKVFDGYHVHHMNDCIHDNRPENLILLTPAEHGKVTKGLFKVDKDQKILYRELEAY